MDKSSNETLHDDLVLSFCINKVGQKTQRKWPFLVRFWSIHFSQLAPLHFEVSGPQTQHSNEANVLLSQGQNKGREFAVVRKVFALCSDPMLINRCCG